MCKATMTQSMSKHWPPTSLYMYTWVWHWSNQRKLWKDWKDWNNCVVCSFCWQDAPSIDSHTIVEMSNIGFSCSNLDTGSGGERIFVNDGGGSCEGCNNASCYKQQPHCICDKWWWWGAQLQPWCVLNHSLLHWPPVQKGQLEIYARQCCQSSQSTISEEAPVVNNLYLPI